jgi:hypothetical protein
MGIAAVAAVLVSACTGLQSPATAQAEPGAVAALDRYSVNQCNPVVAQALAGANVPISQVDGLAYGLYRQARTGRIFMYDAFMSLKDQPGNIVVQVDDNCSLKQIYARGGAQLPQVATR